MSETVARARMFGFYGDCGDLVALERHHYEKHPDGDVVFCEVAEKLERERDEARRECSEAQDGWSRALDERDDARRERDEFRKNSLALVEELKKSVIRLAKERDEARRELAELKTELARVSQMDQHADKSSVGDSTYVLTQQPCQRASRVGVDPDWTAIGNETTETAEGNRSL